MKQAVLVSLVSLLSFVGGLAVSSSSQAQKAASNKNNVPTARAASTPTPCPRQEEFPKLIADKYVTKFNGPRLGLGYNSGIMSDDVPFAVNSAKVRALRDGDLLVSLGDTLYRLNRPHNIVWRYYTAGVIFDYEYVESTNLIYGTAGDNIMFVLNATNGKEETSESRNGSAAYGVAEKYGDDMCLVTDNFVMYREKFRGDKIAPMNDGITCWRGTKILWHLDFPPDAELVVNGKRILAVTKSSKAIYVSEIIPPQTKSE